MIYGSVCSGIEAASVAWHPLGWTPAFFSEIEPFPRSVLAHHYPNTPLHGDFTTIGSDDYAAIDVLVGGTPCQSFSVAGLRAGLDDERGNLALEFCRLARRLGPRWVVWENVPGVLSMDGGRAFASILGGLAECGYGLAYRVLDAQFVRVDGFGRAVPQRRRRVFVVGCLGSWQRAAAVLFERASLSGHPAPRRQPGQGSAPTLAARTKGGGGLGTDFDLDGGLIPAVSRSLSAARGQACANAEDLETYLPVADTLTSNGDAHSGYRDDAGLVAYSLNAKGDVGRTDVESETFVSEIIPLQDVSQHAAKGGGGGGWSEAGAPMFTLQRASVHGVALRGREGGGTAELTGDVMTSLRTGSGGGDKPHVLLPLLQAWRVRRLMPVECERLQGFPDGYTAIPYRSKPASDGPRYKALGNSMAVNVMRWIGTRINQAEGLTP